MLLLVVCLRVHKLLPWELGFLLFSVLSAVLLLGFWARLALGLLGRSDFGAKQLRRDSFPPQTPDRFYLLCAPTIRRRVENLSVTGMLLYGLCRCSWTTITGLRLAGRSFNPEREDQARPVSDTAWTGTETAVGSSNYRLPFVIGINIEAGVTKTLLKTVG